MTPLAPREFHGAQLNQIRIISMKRKTEVAKHRLRAAHQRRVEYALMRTVFHS